MVAIYRPQIPFALSPMVGGISLIEKSFPAATWREYMR